MIPDPLSGSFLRTKAGKEVTSRQGRFQDASGSISLERLNMDEARDQGSAGNDSVPPRFARLIGQPAPAFSLGGLQGATVPPVDAPAGGACQACDATYPALAQASERYPVIVVGAGDRAVLQEKLSPHGLAPVAGHDRRREVNQAYGVPGYPSVLLIDPQGVVRKGAVGTQGLEQVLAPERKD